ncbi:hypothetical protein [Acinetobacter haemolyticus]|uniref:hypothetical protein n=1 Tax=Acinetobacter haemolyticus TaxID=29430 RepID=UPI001D18AA8D|nr:hypothetical protein [Acinetobacter haemolyticus]
MIVHIIREACCSQDDQLGPLEIQLECDENSTLEQVINEICRVKFLQYSSSHNHMIGRIDDQKIVEILLLKEEIIFHIYKDSLVRNLITESGLRFSFINNIFETVMCAELAGDFHLGDSRQLTDKSLLPFDLVS